MLWNYCWNHSSISFNHSKNLWLQNISHILQLWSLFVSQLSKDIQERLKELSREKYSDGLYEIHVIKICLLHIYIFYNWYVCILLVWKNCLCFRGKRGSHRRHLFLSKREWGTSWFMSWICLSWYKWIRSCPHWMLEIIE